MLIGFFTATGMLLLSASWIAILASLLLSFAFSYFLINYLVEQFIYRKIKLIYKMINQTKATKKEEFYYKNVLPVKSIDEVSEEVEAWAGQYKSEIEMLRKNEVFRKEFLQNLSHELKTPIFSIQGYIDTLLGGALHNEAVNTKFLQNAAKNIDRLVKLVDDLDEISKLEIGELQLTLQYFVVQDLIKEVFESMELQAKEKNILCSIKKGCEAPVIVYADKEKIRQVLLNLTDNAIKYGKYDGKTEASIYKIDENNVLIEISDDGSGILEEHLPRIFERFFRTDLARSRKVGGSGLGLAICKHIIEAHGSTIHVRSKLDVGTTFGFNLAAKGRH
jgi:two-component system phosphate regulon sensor histidine kinase PhoR